MAEIKDFNRNHFLLKGAQKDKLMSEDNEKADDKSQKSMDSMIARDRKSVV